MGTLAHQAIGLRLGTPAHQAIGLRFGTPAHQAIGLRLGTLAHQAIGLRFGTSAHEDCGSVSVLRHILLMDYVSVLWHTKIVVLFRCLGTPRL